VCAVVDLAIKAFITTALLHEAVVTRSTDANPIAKVLDFDFSAVNEIIDHTSDLVAVPFNVNHAIPFIIAGEGFDIGRIVEASLVSSTLEMILFIFLLIIGRWFETKVSLKNLVGLDVAERDAFCRLDAILRDIISNRTCDLTILVLLDSCFNCGMSLVVISEVSVNCKNICELNQAG
jgi:hypothetical protein